MGAGLTGDVNQPGKSVDQSESWFDHDDRGVLARGLCGLDFHGVIAGAWCMLKDRILEIEGQTNCWIHDGLMNR